MASRVRESDSRCSSGGAERSPTSKLGTMAPVAPSGVSVTLNPMPLIRSWSESFQRLPRALPAASRMRFAASASVEAVDRSARKATPPSCWCLAMARRMAEVFPMRRGPYTSSFAAGSRSVLTIRVTSSARSVKYSPSTTPWIRKGFSPLAMTPPITIY